MNLNDLFYEMENNRRFERIRGLEVGTYTGMPSVV